MTWMASKMRHRIEIREGTQTPNDDGGFDLTYSVLAEIWAEFKPIDLRYSGAQYIREEQTVDLATHNFIVRKNSVNKIDFLMGLAAIKSDHFIFLKTKNIGNKTGRLFRIMRVSDVNERGELLSIEAAELQSQQGTEFYD